MKKLNTIFAAAIGLSLSLSATAAVTNKTTSPINVQSCVLDSQSSLDLCTKKATAKIKELSKRKSNFAKNSVLMRFWDKEMDYWVYLVVDKNTNQAIQYPRGLRSSGKSARDVEVTFSGGKICTAGSQVDVIGDEESRAFSDYEADVDYCNDYDPEMGFGVTYQVDAKTRKLLRYTGI